MQNDETTKLNSSENSDRNNLPTKKTPQEKLLAQSDKLDISTTKLATKLVRTKDLDTVKDLTSAFNVAQVKKNVLRTLQLSKLLDKISDNIADRLMRNEMGLEGISDKDLASYMNAIQSVLDKSSKGIQEVSTIDAIQVNQQNNLNINVSPGLSREERENVADAVNAILKRLNEEKPETPIEEIPIEYDIEDIEENQNLLNEEE